MKLNYECMRQVLFALEEQLSLDKSLNYMPISIYDIVKYPILSDNFSKEDIAHSIYMLSDAGLIVHEFPIFQGNDAVCIYSENQVISITYKGHEFLQKIKNDTVWNNAKERLKPLGVMTIEIISQVASNVITQLLTK